MEVEMFVYKILKSISFFAVLGIIGVVYYLFQGVRNLFHKGKWSVSEWIDVIGNDFGNAWGKLTSVVLIVSSLALVISSTTVHQLVGVHNLLLKPEGTYCFYVEAINQSGKRYVLPAQVNVQQIREENRAYRYYYLEKIYFDNGDYLMGGDDPVQIDEISYLYDNKDEEWSIILLNRHAYSPYVEETNNVSWFDLLLLSVELIAIFILLYAILKKQIKGD